VHSVAKRFDVNRHESVLHLLLPFAEGENKAKHSRSVGCRAGSSNLRRRVSSPKIEGAHWET
jgi:hypothetical protein